LFIKKLQGWLLFFLHKGDISKRTIAKFLSENPIIVEAGAHIGRDTVEMSKQWPKGFIHAFEPIPEIFRKLNENVRECQNVKIYCMALAEKTGTATIHVSSGASDASSSLLKPKEHLVQHPGVFFKRTEIVNVTSLVDWKKESGVERIDLLWLDLQGNELNVLTAAEELLYNVMAIYTEVNLKENYENTALYSDLKTYLIGLGFVAIKEKLFWTDAGNVLFIKR
jgi:FkbM family methyltransferase